MDNSRVLIIGASGQLGTELQILLQSKNLQFWAPDSQQLDLTNKNSIKNYLSKWRPQIIFDCAAYTNVDAAEQDPGKNLNWQINDLGTLYLAQAAQNLNATLFYLSTDYVFDGLQSTPYQIDDQPNPQNEYGKAKLAGEQHIRQILNKYYIIRTSWLFGQYGHNFVQTMLHLAKSQPEITVVNDQFGRPTWTRTLAEFMVFAWEHALQFGTYHLANAGSCSWYEFAQEILKNQPVQVLPVTSQQYRQTAYRPRRSLLSLDKVLATGFSLPQWQVALKECLNRKKNNS